MGVWQQQRFPRRVYDRGEEPDPRFSLANERTFLAWIRTALAFFAAGVALHAVELPLPTWLLLTSSVVLIVTGLSAGIQAWVGWVRSERALRTGAVLPAPPVAPLLTIGIVLVAALLVIGLFS